MAIRFDNKVASGSANLQAEGNSVSSFSTPDSSNNIATVSDTVETGQLSTQNKNINVPSQTNPLVNGLQPANLMQSDSPHRLETVEAPNRPAEGDIYTGGRLFSAMIEGLRAKVPSKTNEPAHLSATQFASIIGVTEKEPRNALLAAFKSAKIFADGTFEVHLKDEVTWKIVQGEGADRTETTIFIEEDIEGKVSKQGIYLEDGFSVEKGIISPRIDEIAYGTSPETGAKGIIVKGSWGIAFIRKGGEEFYPLPPRN